MHGMMDIADASMLQVLLVTLVTVLIAYPNPYTRYLWYYVLYVFCVRNSAIESHKQSEHCSIIQLFHDTDMSFDHHGSNRRWIWYHENIIYLPTITCFFCCLHIEVIFNVVMQWHDLLFDLAWIKYMILFRLVEMQNSGTLIFVLFVTKHP